MGEPLAINVGVAGAEQTIYIPLLAGQVFAAALQCTAGNPLTRIPPDRAVPVMHRHKNQALHSVVAQCVHHGDKLRVLDFGFLAYAPAYSRFAEWAPGEFYRGEIHLSFGPIIGFDRLMAQSGAPPLVYDWKVEHLEFPEETARGVQWHTATELPRNYNRPWDCILHCTALSDTPRHTLKP